MHRKKEALGILALVVLTSVVSPAYGQPPNGMVLIPGGEFQMGDHVGGSLPALPVHAVLLDTFFLDVYEVTSQQYADFLNVGFLSGLIEVRDGVVYAVGGTRPYCATVMSQETSRIYFFDSEFSVEPGKENHPILFVSWHGAAAYANWRSAQDGLEPCYNLETWECGFAVSGYRLPTEAEWEYAARGGENDPYLLYPWGDTIDGSNANYSASGDPFGGPNPESAPVGYYDGNQTPAGQDMANGYGLYDMAGNAWEWANDWYNSTYYASSPNENPPGPSNGTMRVVRGGGWDAGYFSCRCFGRFNLAPGAVHHDALGFRLVRRPVTAPIPTVSDWALVAMTLLVLTAGTLVVARRRCVTPR